MSDETALILRVFCERANCKLGRLQVAASHSHADLRQQKILSAQADIRVCAKSLDKAAPPLVIARSGLCDEAIPYCGVKIASPLRGSQLQGG